mgnify:CR=1 FL=1
MTISDMVTKTVEMINFKPKEMKIEIRKETTWEKVWYWTYIDDLFDHVYTHLEDAEKRVDEVVQNYKKPPVKETIKTVIVSDEEEEGLSDCCTAPIIMHDICSQCKEHI